MALLPSDIQYFLHKKFWKPETPMLLCAVTQSLRKLLFLVELNYGHEKMCIFDYGYGVGICKLKAELYWH